MKRPTKTEKLAAEKLAREIGWHNRYAEIELQLSSMDRDADPALVCDLEIELASLGDRIAGR